MYFRKLFFALIICFLLFNDRMAESRIVDTIEALQEKKIGNESAKIEMIERHVPKALRNAFLDFAGAKGSKIYNAFKNRDAVYLAKVFQK